MKAELSDRTVMLSIVAAILSHETHTLNPKVNMDLAERFLDEAASREQPQV